MVYSTDHKTIRNSSLGKAALEVARDAIRRATGPYSREHPEAVKAWWEWQDGSTPFFWMWPPEYQSDIMLGQPHFLTGDFGVFTKAQRPAKIPAQHKLMRTKVVQVRKRNYIEPGSVKSLLHYFCVSKGIDDIRMVYNGTGCGLNEAIWAPRFGLPTVRQTLRSLLPGYYQCDMDIEEMFLNFFCYMRCLRRCRG